MAGITADLEGLARQRTARLDDPTSLAHILFGMLHAGPESSHGAARCIVAFNSATLNDMLHKLGAIPLLVRLLHVDASSYAGTRAIWTLNRRKSNIDNATASAIKNTTRDAGPGRDVGRVPTRAMVKGVPSRLRVSGRFEAYLYAVYRACTRLGKAPDVLRTTSMCDWSALAARVEPPHTDCALRLPF